VAGGRSPVAVARTRAEVVRNQVEVVRSPAAAGLAVADPAEAAVRMEADRPAVAAGWSRCVSPRVASVFTRA